MTEALNPAPPQTVAAGTVAHTTPADDTPMTSGSSGTEDEGACAQSSASDMDVDVSHLCLSIIVLGSMEVRHTPL